MVSGGLWTVTISTRCAITRAVYIPNDNNLPFIHIIVLDETCAQRKKTFGVMAHNRCLRGQRDGPAEKPSTGRLVSSASCRRSMIVLELGVVVIVSDDDGQRDGGEEEGERGEQEASQA